ncbi:MAG: thiamine pyrophosphate-dependent enzyme, partial [Candidatus Sumerlaeaceae bacterium]
TPYTTNKDGRGPAWNNSLFEDNAEFGFGFRLAIDKQKEFAEELLRKLASQIGEQLVEEILKADQSTEAGIQAQRERVKVLRAKLGQLDTLDAQRLALLADYLVKKSVWIVGGDGWAYDIDFGGLDHVFALNRDVNILVLDTEVYSNTGGQQSKATPLGAAAKFAMGGRPLPKKDLALMAMNYGHVYVARVAFGARDNQTVLAFKEAESYPGTSLIIAYSHCIAHGYDLVHGPDQQKLAVESGYWPLFRFDPRRAAAGESPLKLDSPAPKFDVGEFMRNETRFRMVEQMNPERFKQLVEAARHEVSTRYHLYEELTKAFAIDGTKKEN